MTIYYYDKINLIQIKYIYAEKNLEGIILTIFKNLNMFHFLHSTNTLFNNSNKILGTINLSPIN